MKTAIPKMITGHPDTWTRIDTHCQGNKLLRSKFILQCALKEVDKAERRAKKNVSMEETPHIEEEVSHVSSPTVPILETVAVSEQPTEQPDEPKPTV